MYSKVLVLVVFCVLLVKSDRINSRQGPREQVSSRITYPNDFLLPRDQPHHHHHSPGYYSQREYHDYDSNAEELKENESRYGAGNTHSYSNSSMQIPLDFIQKINEYNVSDLLLNFIEDDVEYDQPILLNRFAGDEEDGARNAAKVPKAAGCAPELKTVPIATSDDPSVLYIPQCTRVERCGGCCSHNLLSCQPKETETLTYQVIKTQYTGGQKLKLLAKEIVVVERHTKCKCDCKVKEEHCNKYQEYRHSECRCACSNLDEEKKCSKDQLKKLWNSEVCACQCKEIKDCTTGYYFDQIQCQCVQVPTKLRFTNFERRGYITEVLTVSPLRDDDY